ncbi:hypothetical protein CC80DRAFT_234801 [Byssothecium circinans]|uniref:Uncharacterized protein n=1 Tax=Byssothecium circinans TaxID=147558 RepID=A0A6A5UBF5_9PLEO|nr:hypothetical protein CC80DRAFT_234801 [Byssothecium circinans]
MDEGPIGATWQASSQANVALYIRHGEAALSALLPSSSTLLPLSCIQFIQGPTPADTGRPLRTGPRHGASRHPSAAPLRWMAMAMAKARSSRVELAIEQDTAAASPRTRLLTERRGVQSRCRSPSSGSTPQSKRPPEPKSGRTCAPSDDAMDAYYDRAWPPLAIGPKASVAEKPISSLRGMNNEAMGGLGQVTEVTVPQMYANGLPTTARRDIGSLSLCDAEAHGRSRPERTLQQAGRSLPSRSLWCLPRAKLSPACHLDTGANTL